MPAIDSGEQAVTVQQVLEAASQFDEGEVDPRVVEFDIEPLEHVGSGDVDVRHRLALQHKIHRGR